MSIFNYSRSLTGLLLATSLTSSALADTVKLTSGTQQVSLIELFTSEGCSSCPPAEAWLNRFVDDEKLWKQVIPMAFHVDYWDYIGWKDRFAQKQFSERQYRYQKEGGVRTVYTPGVFLNGKEWRSKSSQLPAGSAQTVGTLSVEVTDQGLTARFDPVEQSDKTLRLYVAVLAFGINTEVAAGENRGRQLAHEFVVVGLNHATSSDLSWQVALPKVRSVGAKRHAIVAWISQDSTLRPLQAVGGWIADSSIKEAG